MSCGCGTVCNLASGDPEVPLGGVRRDLQILDTTSSCNLSGMNGSEAAVLFALIPIELTLSATGDLLTLPLAVYLRQNEPPDSPAVSPSAGPAGLALGQPTPADPVGALDH